MSERTPRILIADDHPIVLMGARAALEQSRNASVAAEARSTDEVFLELSRAQYDVLVTDFSMPGGVIDDGLQYIRMVRSSYPLLPVVVMTMLGNPGVLEQVLDLGVLGLVDKADDLESLPMAVQSASARRLYISKDLRGLLVSRRSERGRRATLSPRESEVIRMLLAGASVTQIADRLGKSHKTVSRQKMEAMRKLGLSTNVELYQYARDNGLLP